MMKGQKLDPVLISQFRKLDTVKSVCEWHDKNTPWIPQQIVLEKYIPQYRSEGKIIKDTGEIIVFRSDEKEKNEFFNEVQERVKARMAAKTEEAKNTEELKDIFKPQTQHDMFNKEICEMVLDSKVKDDVLEELKEITTIKDIDRDNRFL